MHKTVDIMNNNIAMINGRFRPYLSLKAPNINCPAAIPIILAVSPVWTIDVVVLKNPVIEGSPGRYISVINGPNADNAPSNINKNIL